MKDDFETFILSLEMIRSGSGCSVKYKKVMGKEQLYYFVPIYISILFDVY